LCYVSAGLGFSGRFGWAMRSSSIHFGKDQIICKQRNKKKRKEETFEKMQLGKGGNKKQQLGIRAVG